MAQEYDKIIKENLTAIIFPISHTLLGFQIIRDEPLPEKLQVTLEREPDFIRIVETAEQERFILHLEFQSVNDPEMAFREAEYKAILQRKFKLPVRQYVIYLGQQKTPMPTHLPTGWEINQFELKNLYELDYRKLSQSEIPETILLAILGDFHQAQPEFVIRDIVKRLQEVSSDPIQLQKYLRQLNMLSRLRKLEKETLNTIAQMPITFDINEDKIYQMGIEKGISQGIEKGIERKTFLIVRNMLLSDAFQKGKISLSLIAEVAEVPLAQVKEIQQRLKKQHD